MEIAHTLDCRGDVCPYPDVKSKRQAKQMQPGQVLEILVDYPLSAERIPETMKTMNHTVLDVDKVGRSEWKILIRIS